MKNQKYQFWLYILFSILFISGAIYLISYDPFQWFNWKGDDFFVQWLGLRTLAKENISPYLPVVQTTTEDIFYGSSTSVGEMSLKFSSPLYSSLFILPLALFSEIQTAQLVWLIITGIITATIAAISLRLSIWRPAYLLLFLMLFFSLLGFHNLRALASGSMIFLSALFVYSSLLFIRLRRYELAGVFLALSTIQPRVVLLVVLFVLIWSISKRFWAVVVWFLTGVAILVVISLFFIPDWPIQYLRVLMNFKEYYPTISPVAVFSSSMPGMGRQLGWGLSLIMVVILIFEWLAARKKDFNWFLWTVGLTLVLGQWIGIPTDPDDFVILLLPLIIILAAWDRRFKRFGKLMAGFSLLILLVGLWWIFILVSPEANITQQMRIFLFPLPLFLMIGLYWVRWWVIKPQVDFIEEISSLDRF